MKMLNIGCGTTSNSEWINIDLGGCADVICHNISDGIPFHDRMFDIVYHSHLLEHLPFEKAFPFLKECFRVLKPGGIVRILVPDLEQIARNYLEKLSTAQEFEAEYDWAMLEMYDQCVREKTGGQMERFLGSNPEGLSPFVAARMGFSAAQCGGASTGRPMRLKYIVQLFFRVIRRFRLELAAILVYAIAGKKGWESFNEGQFRNSGEVHRWMYDRFSLGRLLSRAGFTEISVVSPFISRFPDFTHYKLDVVDGVVRKPDSLVMEGVRP